MDRWSGPTDIKTRAKAAYDTIRIVWPETDQWSLHTRSCIEEIVRKFVPDGSNNVLNAGCGGNDYGIAPRARMLINLDISSAQCRTMRHAVVADVDALPFPAEHFDVVLCVGAVLNYCEPYSAIREIFRVAMSGGIVLLEFETTHSGELLFTRHWGKRVSVIERKYAGRLDKTLLFSERHIRSIIEPVARVVGARRYHTLTALLLRINRFSQVPRKLRPIDKLASRIPILDRLASNTLFICEKI